MRWTTVLVAAGFAGCGNDAPPDDGSTRVLVFAAGPTTIEHAVRVGDNLALAGVTSDTDLWVAKLAKGEDAIGWERGVALTAASPAGNAFAASPAGELVAGRDGTLAALAAGGGSGTGAQLAGGGFDASAPTADGGLALASGATLLVLDPTGAPVSSAALAGVAATGVTGLADGGVALLGKLDAGGYAIARLAPDQTVAWTITVAKAVKTAVELPGGDLVVLGPSWLARLAGANGAIAWQETLAVSADPGQTVALADLTLETAGDSLAAIGAISGGATPAHFVAHVDPDTGAVAHGLVYTTLVGDQWREVAAFKSRTVVVGDSGGHGLVLFAGDDPGRCFSAVDVDTLVAMPASETPATKRLDLTPRTVGALPAADLTLAPGASQLSRSCVMANP